MKATYNTIDWEQRRYELAKSAMNGILSDENEVGYACSEVKYGENEKKYDSKGYRSICSCLRRRTDR